VAGEKQSDHQNIMSERYMTHAPQSVKAVAVMAVLAGTHLGFAVEGTRELTIEMGARFHDQAILQRGTRHSSTKCLPTS